MVKNSRQKVLDVKDRKVLKQEFWAHPTKSLGIKVRLEEVSQDRRIKEWVALKSKDGRVNIGKIQDKKSAKIYEIEHWTEKQDSQEKGIIIERCTGCNREQDLVTCRYRQGFKNTR